MKGIKSARLLVALFVLALGVLSLTQCSKVPAGNVGVKFKLYGDGKGSLQELNRPGFRGGCLVLIRPPRWLPDW